MSVALVVGLPNREHSICLIRVTPGNIHCIRSPTGHWASTGCLDAPQPRRWMARRFQRGRGGTKSMDPCCSTPRGTVQTTAPPRSSAPSRVWTATPARGLLGPRGRVLTGTLGSGFRGVFQPADETWNQKAKQNTSWLANKMVIF
eukprot:EG_transcript_17736